MLGRGRFYARQVLYDLTSGLLFRPAIIIAGLAALALGISTTMASQRGLAWLFPGEPSAAQVVLATIASSMMTVIAVVYSILLVALSLASMQFSTRVLRLLVHDTASQATLGVFVGTFVYCLLLLRVVQGGPDPAVPALGVGIAVILAVAAMGQLLYFIHHIVQYIQANYLLDHLAAETEHVIDAVFPAEPAAAAALPDGWEALPAWPVSAAASGYVQLLDIERLAAVARAADGVVVVHVGIGHFATEGLPIAELRARVKPSDDAAAEVAHAFDVGAVRTMQDDVELGLRQIVDIALKAISPAVNDPSTAATCIDQLGRLVVRASLRREASADAGVGEDGVARVRREVATVRSLVDLAFSQIRQYGRTDMAVSLRLLRVLEGIARVVKDPATLERLSFHCRLVTEAATAHFSPADCEELLVRSSRVAAALDAARPAA